MSYNDSDRAKWEKILVADLISSDESDTEDGIALLIVNELTWRSSKVSHFFEKLDAAHHARKSEQATQQTKRRICKGKLSRRMAPSNLPSWAN